MKKGMKKASRTIVGTVLLRRDDVQKTIGGGLTGDVKVMKSKVAGGYEAHASFARQKLSVDASKKIKRFLESRTGLAWQRNEKITYAFSALFTEKALRASLNKSGVVVQPKLPLNMKKSPLEKACDKWCNLRAKERQAIEQRRAQEPLVLEQMRKVGKMTLRLDDVEFERVITERKESLKVKGK